MTETSTIEKVDSGFFYSLSDRSCMILIDGESHNVDNTSHNWGKIIEALNSPDTTSDELLALISPKQMLEAQKNVTIRGNTVYWGDEQLHGVLADRLISILQQGFAMDRWIALAQNIQNNPSEVAREELYLFMEHNHLPTTSDGCLLAYKMVKDDYTDIRTGTFDNSVGQVPNMPREEVDPDRYNTCSFGLHFCSEGYLSFYSHGPRTMLVKVNPADVVAIPADYDNAKGRAWRYEVVAEVEGKVEDAPAIMDYDTYDEEEAAVVEAEEKKTKKLPRKQKKGAKKATKSAPKAGENDTVIETLMHGSIDSSRFLDLLVENGSLSGIAKAFNMSAGTIQSWKKKLFPNGIN